MKNDNAITVLTFDDRCSYRRDEHYPSLIFLATVLRWAVSGSRVVDSGSFDTEEAIDHNNISIDSTAAFLADNIESGEVPIFSKHSKLLLGNAEKTMVVNKLRSMDGGEVSGLIDGKGFGYYLDGCKLFQTVMRSSLPSPSDFGKGGVWHRLAWDAPHQWRDNLEQGCKSPPAFEKMKHEEAIAHIAETVTPADPGAPESNAPAAPKKRRHRITPMVSLIDSFVTAGIKPHIEPVWLHIKSNAGKDGFPISAASMDSATDTNGKQITKEQLKRALGRYRKKS